MTNKTETDAYTDGRFISPFWKTPHNHDTEQESNRTGLACADPTLAQQHSKEECDINTIVDRFLKTGTLPPVRMPPTYQDFEDVFDFQSALNTAKKATDSFMQLPAKTRADFNNDPHQFVAYVDHCMTTGDLDPLITMGLAVKRPEEAPEPTSKTPPAPTPTPEGGKN